METGKKVKSALLGTLILTCLQNASLSLWYDHDKLLRSDRQLVRHTEKTASVTTPIHCDVLSQIVIHVKWWLFLSDFNQHRKNSTNFL